MMREIKFRAWDINEKRMRDVLNTPINSAGNFIPLQYTGLTDRNGVEIYEGDVVKKKSLGAKLVIGVVEYNEGHACFVVRVAGGLDLIGYGTIRHVIGNIYERPDLLEPVKENTDNGKIHSW